MLEADVWRFICGSFLWLFDELFHKNEAIDRYEPRFPIAPDAKESWIDPRFVAT